MRFNKLARIITTASALALASGGAAHAKTYFLKAERTTVNFDGTDIPMWGYAECTDVSFATCDAPTVPGPALNVRENQSLVVVIKNDLSVGQNGDPVPFDLGRTSFAVSGMRLVENYGPMFWGAGKFDPAGDPDQPRRVRSMTHEALPGGKRAYRWLAGNNELKAGTYVYHSATHPAVQVQMGLYGPLTVLPAGGGDGYAGAPADASADIFYSEIDANFHADVDSGNYNPEPRSTAARTSVIDYAPTHFLVNGKPQVDGPFTPTLNDPLSGGILGGYSGQSTLVRFRSAALRTHVPMVAGGQQLDVVAETAQPYYFPPNQETTVVPKRQSAVMLPAMTTADAVLVNGKEGGNPIIDRALGATSAGTLNTFVVIPDRVIALAPLCSSNGALIAFARTDSTLAEAQSMSIRISSGVESIELPLMTPHRSIPNGYYQFVSVVGPSQAASFCTPGATVTSEVVSGSGGSHSRTVVMP